MSAGGATPWVFTNGQGGNGRGTPRPYGTAMGRARLCGVSCRSTASAAPGRPRCRWDEEGHAGIEVWGVAIEAVGGEVEDIFDAGVVVARDVLDVGPGCHAEDDAVGGWEEHDLALYGTSM